MAVERQSGMEKKQWKQCEVRQTSPVWAVAKASSMPRPSCANSLAPWLLGQEGCSCAGVSFCTGGCPGPACSASTSMGTPQAGHAFHISSFQHFPPLLIPLPFTTVIFLYSVLFLSPLSLFLHFAAFFSLTFSPLPSSRVAQQSFDYFFRIFSPQKLPDQFWPGKLGLKDIRETIEKSLSQQ